MNDYIKSIYETHFYNNGRFTSFWFGYLTKYG